MILFLDFDGVLHPAGCSVDRLFCRLECLEDWLRSRPEVSVVISSSWREVHPLEEMRQYFSLDLQCRVVGKTPVLDGGVSREAEILAWLAASSAPAQPWVALDDMPALFSPGLRQLMAVDGATGLTKSNLALVDALIPPR